MKKALLVLPLIIIAVVALALTGKLNIPGLTPKQAAKNAAAMYAEKKDPIAPAKKPSAKPAVAANQTPKKKPQVALTRFDAVQGASSLAKVWNEIPIPTLAKIVKQWKDGDLATVLGQMDTTQVAKLITAIGEDQPTRASSLSKSIQKQNSVVEVAQ